MRTFKQCPITKKMHNTSKKRCVECERKRHREGYHKFKKSKKYKAWAKRKMESQKGTLKKDAYHKIYYAILRKNIPKPTVFRCFDCRKPAEVYDHRDYLKPYDVEPVCKVCNHKRGPGKNGSRKRSVK